MAAQDIRETIVTKMADVPPDASQPPPATLEEERTGKIIVQTRLQRSIFLFSLFAPAVLLVLLVIADALRAAPTLPSP
jgi:hypothetical protein